MIEQCFDLCEIFPALIKEYDRMELLLRELYNLFSVKQIKRIYIGSSFCGNYFLGSIVKNIEMIIDLCEKNSIAVSLVVPIFHQHQLSVGKKLVTSVVKSHAQIIDEVVVNDVGMLEELLSTVNCKLRFGRVFYKKARDLRYRSYQNQITLVEDPDGISEHEQINGFDIDITTNQIIIPSRNDHRIIGVHTMYTYMSTGNICNFASITHNSFSKFKSDNSQCQMHCNSFYLQYLSEQKDVFYRIGKTMFYKNTLPTIKANQVRYINFPFELWECRHELISSNQ